MPLGSISVRRGARWAWLLGLLVVFLTGCAENYPQTTLLPRGDFARMVDDVLWTTIWWAIAVFVVVEGVLIYAILRYRGKPSDAEPDQVHGNTTLEIIWTAIPAFILAMIAVPTIKTIFRTAEAPPGDVLLIKVIGHQWWWEFRYPSAKIVTANELHVPVGRTVELDISSADVLHSFWVPQFSGKRDAFPTKTTHIFFKAEVAGNYPGQCAEFCGIQHSRMAYRIVAQTPEEFQAWLSKQAAPRTVDSAAMASVHQVLPVCASCHAFSSADTTPGRIGPNLGNVGSRSYIGAGLLKNTDENLARWIKNPQEIKHGVAMPALGLKDDQIAALVAYLRAHNQ